MASEILINTGSDNALPKAIAWANVDLPSMRFCDTHLKPISQEVLNTSASKMSLKIL